ncbi:hypothetical protein HU830_02700 [Lactobacillus sp. DCY120]|uniref:DUF3324 domain-containing protein n=1 Tax=Bombilactobacillus apium TaxID=2675299 RepID=A0A850QZH4_9LACO|nr:hypothetical protein [Bombilactobacillus apium]NVY96093.1 hypothetical protein [Bombilactobacillus apium]
MKSKFSLALFSLLVTLCCWSQFSSLSQAADRATFAQPTVTTKSAQIKFTGAHRVLGFSGRTLAVSYTITNRTDKAAYAYKLLMQSGEFRQSKKVVDFGMLDATWRADNLDVEKRWRANFAKKIAPHKSYRTIVILVLNNYQKPLFFDVRNPAASQKTTMVTIPQDTGLEGVDTVDKFQNPRQIYLDEKDNRYRLLARGTASDLQTGGLTIKNLRYQVLGLAHLPQEFDLPAGYPLPQGSSVPRDGAIAYLRVTAQVQNSTNKVLHLQDGGLLAQSFRTPQGKTQNLGYRVLASTSVNHLQPQATTEVTTTLYLTSAKSLKKLKRKIPNGKYHFTTGAVQEGQAVVGSGQAFTLKIHKY